MTEDDTFRRLKRAPLKEARRVLELWLDIPEGAGRTVPAYHMMLEEIGWTSDDLMKELKNVDDKV